MDISPLLGRSHRLRPTPSIRWSKLPNALRSNLSAYAFVLPGLAFLAVWLVYPVFSALNVSLHEWNLMPGTVSPFVGLDQYFQAITDKLFWSSMANTVRYALITVFGQLVLGLVVALILDKITRGRVFFRAVYYIPVITSWVVVSLLFRYLFNSSPAGFMNYLLVDILHILAKPVAWLNAPGTAFIAVYALGIYKGVGWTMVIFLAALQSIPEECSSAAAIDGANERQVLSYITLPLLLPTIGLVTIMLTIGAFQTYIPIALITEGGPLHRTEVILSYMYDQAFNDLKFGYSAALSFILAGIVFTISQAQLRLTRLGANLYS